MRWPPESGGSPHGCWLYSALRCAVPMKKCKRIRLQRPDQQQRPARAVLQIPAKAYPALVLCRPQSLVIPRPSPPPTWPQWVSGRSPESVRMARSDIARNPDVGHIWHPALRSEVIDAANLREVYGEFSTCMASNHDPPPTVRNGPPSVIRLYTLFSLCAK